MTNHKKVDLKQLVDDYLAHYGVNAECPGHPTGYLGFKFKMDMKHKVGLAGKQAMSGGLIAREVISIKDFERNLEASAISERAIADLMSYRILEVKQ